MGNLIYRPFQPVYWLPSAHHQTIWPSLFRTRASLSIHWERVELPDGDFIDLAWHQNANRPIVLLLHGLEGSIDSHYARNTMAALHQAGYNSVLMHFRGCSRESNRLPQSYHSGATDDLRLILRHLQDTSRLPTLAIGVSLGGNLLLKYLGEEGSASLIPRAIAISVPFQLATCAQTLQTGFAALYGQYLLRQLKSSYQRKFEQQRSPLAVSLPSIKTLWQFDEKITAPLHGFCGAEDYYRQCSCAQFLPAITIPTLIIHASDDPFMTPAIIPTTREISPTITLEVYRHGGHVGFIGRADQQATPSPSITPSAYWLESRIIHHLQTTAEDHRHQTPRINQEIV